MIWNHHNYHAKDNRSTVRNYVNESKGGIKTEMEKLEDRYFGKGLKQNPAQLGQFPYYYYSLGHLNKERQLFKQWVKVS